LPLSVRAALNLVDKSGAHGDHNFGSSSRIGTNARHMDGN
jgi:hypothetical protein